MEKIKSWIKGIIFSRAMKIRLIVILLSLIVSFLISYFSGITYAKVLRVIALVYMACGAMSLASGSTSGSASVKYRASNVSADQERSQLMKDRSRGFIFFINAFVVGIILDVISTIF